MNAINEKVVAMANLVYSVCGNGTGEDYAAVASCLLRSPRNYELSNMDTLTESLRVDELARQKFNTQENETKYKQILSIVSALMNGRKELVKSDIVIEKKEAKRLKEEGSLDSFKKTGSTDLFNTYVLNDGNKD